MRQRHCSEIQADLLARRGLGSEAKKHLATCLRCRIENAFLKKFYRNFAFELRRHPHVDVEGLLHRGKWKRRRE